MDISAQPLPSRVAPDLLVRLEDLASTLALRTLQHRGHELSQAHRDFLLDTCVGLGTLANRNFKGRYVLDLPAGLGKTTLLVCWTKAMMQLGLGWSVAICAVRVKELTDILADLTNGVAAVPEDQIGLWHGKDEADMPATFPEGQEHLYATRPILLLTHSRVQIDPNITEKLQYGGFPRNLLFFDESLITTNVWEVPYADLAGDIKRLWAMLRDKRRRSVGFLEQLGEALDQEVKKQMAGASPTLLKPLTSDPNILAEAKRQAWTRFRGADGRTRRRF